MDRKIFVVGGDSHYTCWMEGDVVDSMAAADLVVFTGGEDVSPFIYRQANHPKTFVNYDRDIRELCEFKAAVNMGKHLIGICRGAQFLCANSGGILVQHQENPSYLHEMDTYWGEKVIVTSTHHQAQFPWKLPATDFKVLGWTTGVSKFHEGVNDMDELVINEVAGNKEVEICYYPKFKALAIQSHPEMLYGRPGKEVHKSIGFMRGILNMHLNNTFEENVK